MCKSTLSVQASAGVCMACCTVVHDLAKERAALPLRPGLLAELALHIGRAQIVLPQWCECVPTHAS